MSIAFSSSVRRQRRTKFSSSSAVDAVRAVRVVDVHLRPVFGLARLTISRLPDGRGAARCANRFRRRRGPKTSARDAATCRAACACACPTRHRLRCGCRSPDAAAGSARSALRLRPGFIVVGVGRVDERRREERNAAPQCRSAQHQTVQPDAAQPSRSTKNRPRQILKCEEVLVAHRPSHIDLLEPPPRRQEGSVDVTLDVEQLDAQSLRDAEDPLVAVELAVHDARECPRSRSA